MKERKNKVKKTGSKEGNFVLNIVQMDLISTCLATF